MKKNYVKYIGIALFIVSSFSIQSCTKDDDSVETIIPVGIAVDPSNLKGNVTNGETVTLDPTKVYNLTGTIAIKDGGKLVIPAGTRIVSTAGASSYIIVEQGGQIFANGTAGSPVLFTSSTSSSGSWGGLVLCGKAPINIGTSSTSSIGNITYGGTSETDNSGALTYVRIEYSGINYNSNNKFNGLSLFGVGNQTNVSNIALINGSDDGIEIFGGTVNVSNIVSMGNENNAFSWTEGWDGSATNIYTKRRTNGVGNRGILGNNNTSNNDASPRSNPTIKNVTFIGDTSGDSDAIKLQTGTYATISNIVLSNWTTGFNIESDASVTFFNGEEKLQDILFDTITTQAIATSTSGTGVPILNDTYTEKIDAKGAGNGILTPTWAIGWSGL
ncbi:hypothetical protein [Chryseobacterium fistulae]|uniref:Uncharacterized protein n=1 Tax=Chryseobacterium fistulae TaxID=2675058 RepID=A0A6N4XS50_9FLAO|nr:hypothetical protein [Chryseobacterium fistulae]CAA7386986.1 hypothetical protein CHRY9393_01287 [Chryseobacterium fistulae]